MPESVSEQDIRRYKGKYLVSIVKKSKGNYLVEAIDECKAGNKELGYRYISPPEQFTTVPRLLYHVNRLKLYYFEDTEGEEK